MASQAPKLGRLERNQENDTTTETAGRRCREEDGQLAVSGPHAYMAALPPVRVLAVRRDLPRTRSVFDFHFPSHAMHLRAAPGGVAVADLMS